MTNNNNNLKLITENKKPFETVAEIKNEVPTFEEFMKTYENDGNLNYDDLSGGDIGEVKGYGPCIDGRSFGDCYCSREELWNQRTINITNITIKKSIEYIMENRWPGTLPNPDDKACYINLWVHSRIYFYICTHSNRFLTNYSSSLVSWGERWDSTIPGDSHLRYYTKELIITSLGQLKELRRLIEEGNIQMLTNETSQGSTSSEKKDDIKLINQIISEVENNDDRTASYSFDRPGRKEDCVIQ